MKTSPRILITAGEESADRHAAYLAREIRRIMPDAVVFGMGGHEMQKAGVRILYSMKEFSVMGFSDVLPKLAGILRIYSGLKKIIRETKPDVFIPVDLPDFNMRLGEFAKKQGVKVLYYIAPQAWAWRAYRAKTLARITDGLAVIFPFEEDFFRKSGVNCRYVGHPFLEENAIKTSETSWPVKRIVLMPGSRKDEIVRMLPVMVQAKRIIDSRKAGLKWMLPVAKGLNSDFIRGFTDGDIELAKEIPEADLAIMKSGTGSFEVALKGIPGVICYKTSPINYVLAKIFVKVNYIGMPNIALGKGVVPELIQHDFTPGRVAEEVIRYMQDRKLYENTRDEFIALRKGLEGSQASLRTAEWVRDLTAKA
jgi:lipid-A-disaccharide synthase